MAAPTKVGGKEPSAAGSRLALAAFRKGAGVKDSKGASAGAKRNPSSSPYATRHPTIGSNPRVGGNSPGPPGAGPVGGPLSCGRRTHVYCFALLDALQRVIRSGHRSHNVTLALPVARPIVYGVGPQRRAGIGIAEGLIRLSVGIEDLQDLREDLAQALKACGA